MFYKEKMYVCKGCGAMCRKDVETLPEWEADFGPDELKQLSEKEYCIWDEWCRECVDKKGFILFDSKHPVIKYLNQRKQYKTLVAEEFKAVKKMFIENLTDEILWQLNTKAFDWFVRETKCGKKKAAKAFCRDAEKQIKKHIENEIYNNHHIVNEKAKLDPLRDEMLEFVNKIDVVGSLKVSDDEEKTRYSAESDNFFICGNKKYSRGKMEEFVDTEDEISGKLWAELFKELEEIMSY